MDDVDVSEIMDEMTEEIEDHYLKFIKYFMANFFDLPDQMKLFVLQWGADNKGLFDSLMERWPIAREHHQDDDAASLERATAH